MTTRLRPVRASPSPTKPWQRDAALMMPARGAAPSSSVMLTVPRRVAGWRSARTAVPSAKSASTASEPMSLPPCASRQWGPVSYDTRVSPLATWSNQSSMKLPGK
jgi:hypothetical protein